MVMRARIFGSLISFITLKAKRSGLFASHKNPLSPSTIIEEATVTGEDQFTGAVVLGKSPAVNTGLPDDFSNGGAVQ